MGMTADFVERERKKEIDGEKEREKLQDNIEFDIQRERERKE